MSDLGSLHRADLVRAGSGEFVAVARTLLEAKGEIGAAQRIAAARRLTPRTIEILKTGVAAGATTVTGWAEQITPYQTIANAFEATLPKFGAFDFIISAGGFLRVPMHTNTGVTTIGATGATVDEGAPAPITELTLARETLQERKSIVIIVVTDELIKSSSTAAFNLLGDELRRGIARAVDVTFLNSIIDDTNVASTSSTGLGASELVADLTDGLLSLSTGATSRVFVIMPPSTMKVAALLRGTGGAPIFEGLGISGGQVNGMTFVPSDALTTDIVILDAAQCAADVGPIELDASKEAAVQLQTDPQTGARILVPLFQTNMRGLRAIRSWAAQLLRPAGAYVISNVSVTA